MFAYEQHGLGLDVSAELRNNPKVADLLISMFYSIAQNDARLELSFPDSVSFRAYVTLPPTVYVLFLFVCFIASQHTLDQLRLQQYTTPTVYVSSKLPSRDFPALHKSHTLCRLSLYPYTRVTYGRGLPSTRMTCVSGLDEVRRGGQNSDTMHFLFIASCDSGNTVQAHKHTHILI